MIAHTSVQDISSDFYLHKESSCCNVDLSYKISPYRQYFLLAAKQLSLVLVSDPVAYSKQSMQSMHSTPSNSDSSTVISAAASALANCKTPVERSSNSGHSQNSSPIPTPLPLPLLFPLPLPLPFPYPLPYLYSSSP